MNIQVVKNSPVHNHVRVQKFIEYFNENTYDVEFICWLRNAKDKDPNNKEYYLLSGGGSANWKLAIYYPIWMIKLFWYFVFKKHDENTVVFVTDFDSAFPIYLASVINRSIKYIYDIHDDFALRYHFPSYIKSFVSYLDYLVKSKSECFIHVDESRVREKDENYKIIYNSPADYYHKIFEKQIIKERVFVVSGLLLETRGVNSIYNFASKNPLVKFIVAGNPIDDISKRLIKLSNVQFVGYLKQADLFSLIKNSAGIFSLYDPALEINRLAASNKLYDAMMLGVPVIVNKGILAESFVAENNVGFVVNYEYDSSWDILSNVDFDEIQNIGMNGRRIYENKYSYEKNIDEKLDGVFYKLIIRKKTC